MGVAAAVWCLVGLGWVGWVGLRKAGWPRCAAAIRVNCQRNSEFVEKNRGQKEKVEGGKKKSGLKSREDGKKKNVSDLSFTKYVCIPEDINDNVVCAVPRYRTNVLCSSVLACAARTE